MLKFINFKIFFFFLAIGIFINYIRGTQKNVIYKFPTPDNNNIIYNTSDPNMCFKFENKQVDCDENSYSTPIVSGEQ